MLRYHSIVTFFSKTTLYSQPSLRYVLLKPQPLNPPVVPRYRLFMKTTIHGKPFVCEDLQVPIVSSFSEMPSISTSMGTCDSTESTLSSLSKKSTKKSRREAPENVLRHKLDMCSKNGNLPEALRLYDEARLNQIPLSQHHYNVLLYLCSSFSSKNVDNVEELAAPSLGLDRGFEIFQQMSTDQIPPNEATYTSLARLAVAKEDPGLAFDLVKNMTNQKIPPRLRSYGPALFGYCKKGDYEGAYAVEAHMLSSSVSPEEPELSSLLQVSVEAAKGEKVYKYLHQLRATVRQVSESTAMILERWFQSSAAAEVGIEVWDYRQVQEGMVKRGGGAHGVGWLGKGGWKVVRSQINKDGACGACGERLVCIDIDPVETQNFAHSLAKLACEKEVKADFTRFQDWLARNGPFEAVIDGANVSLHDQQYFSFRQLTSVVNGMRQMSPSKKLPLVILHSRRVKGGPAEKPNNKKLIEMWRKAGTLYATPPGSNDDWYWLYAAVSSKCLLATNDKMRDHLFELLGKSFFPRWMEKHQVRFTFSREEGLTFHMPPPYSIVIQESERGSWHIPLVAEDDIEVPRQWICATRALATPLRDTH